MIALCRVVAIRLRWGVLGAVYLPDHASITCRP
jgi:hypothetical protein